MNAATSTLKNKVALVTGAGRGIGQAIAIAYGGAGAKVACAARSADQLADTVGQIQQAGGEALAVPTDVTNHGAVQNMLAKTVAAFGGLDLILINAGGSTDRTRVGDAPAEDWVACIELNLIGAYYCAREAIPHLKARGGGKILTMGSGMGHRGMPGNSSYAVSKAGLWMMVRVLAQELVQDNISVNEIVPGPVKTFLTQQEDSGTRANSPFGVSGEWIKEPRDVVPLALWLAEQPMQGPTAQSYSLMRRDG